MKYLEKSKTFTEDNLIWLDECVLAALELFQTVNIKKWDFSKMKKPLIAGSGNAIVTAKIIFSEIDAIFCDETNFDASLDKDIDWLIILSASGEKHAPIFAKKAKIINLETFLITCNAFSSTAKIVWEKNTIITAKNREAYTYNTSTYMGWILANTWENPKNILENIQNTIDPILEKIDFWKYTSYLLVTPNKFAWVNQLFTVKFIELFGRKIARDVFSYEHLNHAITVIPDENELAISFWEGEFDFANNRLQIPLSENIDLAEFMAIWYYIIWKIQKSYPNYFQEHIKSYIKRANDSGFSKWLSVIVD